MHAKLFFIILSTCSLVAAQNKERPSGATEDGQIKLPEVEDLERIGPGQRPSREASRDTAFVIETQKHAVLGDAYVILTDHNDRASATPLKRLAKHRKGTIIRTDDLAKLHQNPAEMKRIRTALVKARVGCVAIAPRPGSYRENMVLGIYELLSTLDDDPLLDAYPGFLLASSAESLANLVDRSINHKPRTQAELRPFLLNQVPTKQELRSLQKSGIIRKMFEERGKEAPVMAIYSPKAKGAPVLPGNMSWQVNVTNRKPLKKIPSTAADAFNDANLLVMHGHGIPGMSCGLDIDALPDDLDSMVVLCGSCFSAAPKQSDLPTMRQAPGGYAVTEIRDAFALRAADRGAVAVFGHMRLNSGFPYLFPVLETWLDGRTVGEGYQELMNAIIVKRKAQAGGFVVTSPPDNPQRIPQNAFLYVVIGDPALQPFEKVD